VRCMSPLWPFCDIARRARDVRFAGVKRTCRKRRLRSESDPERTFSLGEPQASQSNTCTTSIFCAFPGTEPATISSTRSTAIETKSPMSRISSAKV